MRRAILRAIVRFLFVLLSRLDIQGLDNIPKEGCAILSANHLGRLDSALIFILLDRTDATGMVGDTYKKNLFFRWLIESVNGIWVNRGQADLSALREAREYLQKGGLLGIAPEGTRSRTGALQQAKTGVAYLADKTGAPIIPIAISGTEKVFRELGRLHRPRIRVRIGELFTLPPLDRRNRNLSLDRNTDEIMCHIAAMLPSQYRGVYAQHPRLQELLTT